MSFYGWIIFHWACICMCMCTYIHTHVYTHTYTSVKMSIRVLCPSLFSWVAWMPYMFWIVTHHRVCELQLHSPILEAAFLLCWQIVLLCQSFSGWTLTCLFSLWGLVLLVSYSQKSLPRSVSKSFPPVFSSRSFTISGLTFKSVIHFLKSP